MNKGKQCRWCGKVFSPVEVPERFCSKKCSSKAAGINTKDDAK